MLQMLVDDIGDVTITNDGATILRLLEVEHPAAKVGRTRLHNAVPRYSYSAVQGRTLHCALHTAHSTMAAS